MHPTHFLFEQGLARVDAQHRDQALGPAKKGLGTTEAFAKFRAAARGLALVQHGAQRASVAILTHGHHQRGLASGERHSHRVGQPAIGMHDIRLYFVQQSAQADHRAWVGQRRWHTAGGIGIRARQLGRNALHPVDVHRVAAGLGVLFVLGHIELPIGRHAHRMPALAELAAQQLRLQLGPAHRGRIRVAQQQDFEFASLQIGGRWVFIFTHSHSTNTMFCEKVRWAFQAGTTQLRLGRRRANQSSGSW